MRRLLRYLVPALGMLLLFPGEAWALPAAAVVSFFAAVGVTTTAGSLLVAVTTFAVNTAISFGLSKITNKLFGPKLSKSNQERQASVLSLSIGEGPREAIFGRATTGGTLLDAFNFGGTNGTDWEVLVVKVADHKCDALEGFYVGDTFYTFSADGLQAGFNNQLEVYWRNGDAAQTALSYLVTNSASRLYGTPWTSSDVCAGMAYVVFAYKADAPNATSPVWPQGRPQLKSTVRGKLCYDPRKDSTVPGGSGAHRWATPSTWEWSENARICDYNYDRGIYAKDQVTDPTQLLVGRGLSEAEAKPERVFAAANLCDEDVALKAGGTEKRYRVGCVVFADEPFITVKENFAAAMAGEIVKRDGGVEIEAGAAKSVVLEITDDDLVIGEAVGFEPFQTDNDRVNTVIPRYIEPAQLWKDHAAPVRRSTSDITTDGGQKVEDLSLAYVTSGTQAQRCGEIRRRLARKERRATIVLPPVNSNIEDGDWIGWTSNRRLGGSRVVFRVEGSAIKEDYRTALVLREIASDCYGWTAATDEGTPGEAPIDEAGPLAALALSGVSIVSLLLVGDNDNAQPAIQATWTTPVDPAIRGVRLEVRQVGASEATVSTSSTPNDGQLVTTDGVIGQTDMEGRVVPISIDGRRVTASSWTAITTGEISIGALSAAFGDGVLTPGEKLFVVPVLKALIASRAALRAQADLENLVSGFAAARTNYENAATALDSALAALTTPVAWDNSSDVTDIPAPATFRTVLENAITTERVLQATLDYILSVKRADSRNLFRKQDWAVSGGASLVTPSYGVSGWGYQLPAATAGAKVSSAHGGYGFLANNDRYTITFRAKATGGVAAGTIRGKFRDTLGNPITGIADKPFSVTSTAQTFSWVGVGSDDTDFPTAVISLTEDAGDIPSGVTVEITDLKIVYGDQVTQWSPSPDDPELLRIATYLGELDADKTLIHTASAITGQGALATLSTADFATRVSGTAKPENNATKSIVYRQSSAPSSPTTNDIWVQLNGSGVPIAVYSWTGSSWSPGADVTSFNVAASITGQTSWATATIPSGLTPTLVGQRTQYQASDGKFYDYRGLLFGYSVSDVAGRGTDPLSVSANSVTIASHSVLFPQLPSFTSISVPSGSASGLSFDTNYTVFYRPAAGTFHVTQSVNAPAFFASVDEYMWIGDFRTEMSGGGWTDPTTAFNTTGRYSYLDCVAADAFLASGARAGDAMAGDPLTQMSLDGDRTFAGEVLRASLASAACRTIRTRRGAVLTVSDTAPMMTRASPKHMPEGVYAADLAWGAAVPILLDGELVWDVVTAIEPVGVRTVARLTCARGGGVFAAADDPAGPFLFTHNDYLKP